MISTYNPTDGQKIKDYNLLTAEQLSQILDETRSRYESWKKLSYRERGQFFLKMAGILRQRKESLALLITSEMGKIVTESQAEVEKCAWLCEHYAENTESLLKDELIPTDAGKSYVSFQPLGTVFAIMPWNFPFWQVFRAAVPTMMAGNTMVLKHAPNVFGCAEAIQQLFVDSGFPDHAFNNLPIGIDLVEQVVAHPSVCGITLTGSGRAGKSVASLAGKYLKKCVLELGGSDPYIVMDDADINQACKTGVCSRMLNAGQVCISAKRFIVEQAGYDRFVEEQKSLLENMKLGDPTLPETDMGPMAREDLVEQLEKQIADSVAMGAKVVTGGQRIPNTLYYQPTLLVNVTPEMPVYREETFGPVSVVIPAKDADEAVQIANQTTLGLGASLWTSNPELAEKMASQIEAGAVFVNGMTKSDPRLPFGGIKQSGFGRELGSYGIKEFLNIKTVWIK